MLEFLVDNTFMVFGGKIFKQKVGIPMGTNCAPLLAEIFLYSYEAEFIKSLLSQLERKSKHLSSTSYTDTPFTYCPPITKMLRIIWVRCIPLIKDTKENNTSASYLDLLLSIWRNGQQRTSLYGMRDDFNFHITSFPFLSSNFPSSPVYGVFISGSYDMQRPAPLMNALF